MIIARINNYLCDYITRLCSVNDHRIFEALTSEGVNAIDAIEADSWAELASVGEIFDGGSFDIEIIEC